MHSSPTFQLYRSPLLLGVQPVSKDLLYLLNSLPLQGLRTLVMSVTPCFLPMAQQKHHLWSFILSLWDAGRYLVVQGVWEHPRYVFCELSCMRQLSQGCLQQQETALEEPGCALDSTVSHSGREDGITISGHPQNALSRGWRKHVTGDRKGI